MRHMFCFLQRRPEASSVSVLRLFRLQPRQLMGASWSFFLSWTSFLNQYGTFSPHSRPDRHPSILLVLQSSAAVSLSTYVTLHDYADIFVNLSTITSNLTVDVTASKQRVIRAADVGEQTCFSSLPRLTSPARSRECIVLQQKVSIFVDNNGSPEWICNCALHIRSFLVINPQNGWKTLKCCKTVKFSRN